MAVIRNVPLMVHVQGARNWKSTGRRLRNGALGRWNDADVNRGSGSDPQMVQD